MKILVTGGCGAIGTGVILWFLENKTDWKIINFDKLTYAAHPLALELHKKASDHYRFVQGDICNSEAVMKVLKEEAPDVILHLAAETHVDNSFGNSMCFTKTNVLGTHTLLECVKTSGVRLKLFVHMSTDEVYGSVGEDEEAKTEDAMFAPSNPYAATKAAAEMICHAYIKSFKLPIAVVRCNNVVSPWQHEEKLIPRAISLLTRGKKMTIHGDGSAKRTFVHAFDIASALTCIIQNMAMSSGEVYNIGSKKEYTVLEVVRMIWEIIQEKKNDKDTNSFEEMIEYVPDRAFQDMRYHIDSKSLRNLGWTEKHHDLYEVLKEMVDAEFVAPQG